MRSIGSVAREVNPRFPRPPFGIPKNIPQGWSICPICKGNGGGDCCRLGLIEEQCETCRGLKLVKSADDGKFVPCRKCGRDTVVYGMPAKYRDMTFDSFELLTLEKEQAAALAECRLWAENPEGVLLLQGGTGRGKTGLAAGIANATKLTTRWLYWPSFLGDCRRTLDREDPRDPEFLIRELCTRAPLIVIDDWGAMFGKSGEWRSQIAASILENRQKPMVVTTMLASSEIEEQFGDHVRSRLREMATVVSVEGGDLRG